MGHKVGIFYTDGCTSANSQKEAAQVICLAKGTGLMAGNDDLLANFHGARVYCWRTTYEWDNGHGVATIAMVN